jgi:hypothetical protein
VADDPDRLAGVVDRADEAGDGIEAAQLVGQPATGDHEGVQRARVGVRCDDVGPRREPVLAVHRVKRHPDRGHSRARLAQAHHGHPVLEVLDAFGDEDGDTHPGERRRAWLVDGHRAGPLVSGRSLST